MHIWVVIAAVVAGVALILSSKQLIAWLQNTLSASPDTLVQPGENVDAVIVLGYALWRDGTPTRPLKGRVLHGVQAWQQRTDKQLVFSGAHPGDGLRSRSEASAMACYGLQLLGQTSMPTQWVLEEQSTSTRENAMYSLALSKEWSRVLVVTNTFHQLRSYMVFKKAAQDLHLNIQVRMAKLPFIGHQGWGGGPLLDTAMDHVDFWRELLALMYYRFRGFI